MKRRRVILFTAFATCVGLGLLLWGLCAPRDASNIPGYSGDYLLGQAYVLQVPVGYSADNQWFFKPRTPATDGPADTIILPAGTRIRVTRIYIPGGFHADNQPSVRVEGEILDGLATSKRGDLFDISKLGRAADTAGITQRDPDVLR